MYPTETYSKNTGYIVLAGMAVILFGGIIAALSKGPPSTRDAEFRSVKTQGVTIVNEHGDEVGHFFYSPTQGPLFVLGQPGGPQCSISPHDGIVMLDGKSNRAAMVSYGGIAVKTTSNVTSIAATGILSDSASGEMTFYGHSGLVSSNKDGKVKLSAGIYEPNQESFMAFYGDSQDDIVTFLSSETKPNGSASH